MTRRKAVSAALMALLVTGGCTAGPDYVPPPIVSEPAAAPRLVGASGSAFADTPPPPGWWRLYGNPTLDGLIGTALARNTDLRAALASLQAADAALRLAERQRTPSTSLSVNPEIAQASADENGLKQEPPPTFVLSASEMLSYDFDVAGRLRRQVEAMRAEVGAQQAALDYARIMVAAETANAYATICATGLQIAVTNLTIENARGNLNVAQRFFAAGIVGRNDVVRARTQVEQTVANLPDLLARKRAATFMLATLIGDVPERIPAGVAQCAAPPVLRAPLPVGDGVGMLRRRPDVRQAERRLAASVAQIGVASAELYPNVSLGASIGEFATSVPDIVKYRAFKWSVGPLVSWTFPNTSRTRARIAQSDAQARQALAQFDGTVLTALRQTETALSDYAQHLDTERALRLARNDAATAFANVRTLYRGGVAPFLDLLDAQRTLAQADISLAQATAQVSQDQVTVFQVLGGGWQGAPHVIDVGLSRVTRSRDDRTTTRDAPAATRPPER